MIRIKTYTELPQKESFFNLYLYLAAKSMPFYPKDIFYEGFFYEHGREKKQISCFSRQPRQRTPNYIKVLKTYGIHAKSDDNRNEQEKQDALLAETIIEKYSKVLHDFLYSGYSGGRVNPNNLRTILTTRVDQVSLKQLPFFEEDKENNDVKIKDVKIKYKNDLLNHVFRYDKFSDQKDIYRLIAFLDVKVCPYCNRLYTTTSKRGRIRPQLDHYRNKSKFPYFALSIMNLVPCCGVCNQSKGDKTEEVLYPYAEEMGEFCTFEVDAKKDITALTGTHIDLDKLSLSLKNNGSIPCFTDRVNKSKEIFKLEVLYRARMGDVKSILLQRYIFSDEMLQEVADSFPELFGDLGEVRSFLALGRNDNEPIGNLCLGKLRYDITKELDKLYENLKEQEQ